MPFPKQVIVRPILASQSRTLWTARWATVATVVAAILPTIASVILDLIGNPVIANIVANKVPVEYRAGIAIVFSLIIQRFGYLRKTTTAPIAGTPAAIYAVPANNLSAQSAPPPTEGGNAIMSKEPKLPPGTYTDDDGNITIVTEKGVIIEGVKS